MSTPPPDGPTPRDPSRSRIRFGAAPVRPIRLEAAQAPRPPELPAALQRAEAERRAALRAREGAERRSMLRGLILLALIILCLGLVRAGLHGAFPAGWWRRW